ncbi:MAG: redoxin domain-containing protein [Candidatus Methylopumilus sp.]|jgi:thiol-disulfide isomerase/thioredoxin|nr:redoxin domain-containing protein [Candidatus Methylopumilus universalis]MBW0155717.1 redoxin domain-containing protein [Candidatus Methylopumilus sp.]QDC45753.1 redoxin domain-containing protein [Candidatus Methylopumilus universalis]QDC70289.1 redoxin domain-containing protein [Candidatus Methylopumilus universalis]QDC98662.1 redoxin domain-containing protein [Candidatus Methylopumilus universalis]
MKLKIFLFFLFFSHLSFAYDFMPFDMNTRKVIEKRYIDQPLIISFWSIDCPYCIDDLKKLGKALSKNTNVQLITVCVDGKESAKKAERILSQANLPKHEQYQYAEVDEDRLRYNIDPAWYGELPRTYFYDATHQVTPLSGKISNSFLDKWFKK